MPTDTTSDITDDELVASVTTEPITLDNGRNKKGQFVKGTDGTRNEKGQFQATQAHPGLFTQLNPQLRPHYLVAGLAAAAGFARAAANISGEDGWVALGAAVVWFVLVVILAIRNRKSLSKLSSGKRLYAAVCAVAGAIWLAVTSGTDFTFADLATLLVSGYALAVPWWRAHRIPNPILAPKTDPEPESEPEIEPESVEEPEEVVDDGPTVHQTKWEQRVACKSGRLPGSTLTEPEKRKHSWRYQLNMVAGQQTLQTALAGLVLIAGALNTSPSRVIIEQHPDTDDIGQAQVTVVTGNPIGDVVNYTGPSYNPATGCVDLGPFVDGEGMATWQVYRKNGMFGGFVCGATGSGKSRIVDVICHSLMAAGNTVVWYGDPQDGASSSGLSDAADYAARGKNAILRMMRVAKRVLEFRQMQNANRKLNGFTPSAERPGLCIVIEESRVALADPEVQQIVLDIATTGRKLGMSCILASQGATLPAFGGGGSADDVRSNITEGNLILLRTNSNSTKHVLSGVDCDPTQLPKIPGYAYQQASEAHGGRSAPFRAAHLGDEDDASDRWFRRINHKVSLDVGAATYGAADYANRNAIEEVRFGEIASIVQACEAGVLPAGATPIAIEGRPTAPALTARTGGDTQMGQLIQFPSYYSEPIGDDTTVAEPDIALKDAEARILQLIENGVQTPADLRRHTGWGETYVRNKLNSLVDQELIERTGPKGKGVYASTRLPAEAAM